MLSGFKKWNKKSSQSQGLPPQDKTDEKSKGLTRAISDVNLHGGALMLPKKRERRPSLQPDIPGRKQPSVSLHKLLSERRNRISDISDLHTSPRTSVEIESPVVEQKTDDVDVFRTRDSGIGQEMHEKEMTETDARIREVNDIVQVLKKHIDEHVEKLYQQLISQRNELKSKLDNYVTKTCCNLSKGEVENLKVEFQPQDDMAVGVITFTDREEEKALQDPFPSPEVLPEYENWKYVNVPGNMSSGPSSSYEDVSQLDFPRPPDNEFPRSLLDKRNLLDSAEPPMPHDPKVSSSGYVNTGTAGGKPKPPPKPTFRKN